MTEAAETTGRACVGFVDLLRRHGVPVGPEQTTTFYAALHRFDTLRVRDVYWAGRVVLATAREHFPAYDTAFRAYFGPQQNGGEAVPPPPPRAPAVPSPREDQAPGTPSPQAAGPDDEQPDEARLTPSEIHLLKTKSFAAMDPDDRRRAAALIRRLDPELPRRRGRRRVPSATGPHLDVRGLLRAALRTDGEPVRLPRRRVPSRERPLTLVVDVSGSMTPYALALLRFGHVMLHAGHRVEVFTAGVRLTRITDELRRTSVDAALRRTAAAVEDWDGGTLLGTSMRELVDRFGGHGAVRGALVVVCSDGLDRDDPGTLGAAMRDLHRVAHRVVWLNPLKGDPRYRPLQRGMAAALPHVDVFLAGHNLASLEAMCAAVAPRRRSA